MSDACNERLRPGPAQSGEGGMALLITVMALLIVSLTGMVLVRIASTEIAVAANYRGSQQAFYAADGGAEHGLNELLGLGRSLGRFPTVAEMTTITGPPMIDTTFASFQVSASGPQTQGPLTAGFYQGLVAISQPFTVSVTAETTKPPVASSTVTMMAEFDIIPIFQFAIFYEEDLEILPGPNMVLNGRVHSNQDIYIGSGATLTVNSSMTAAGDIFNFRKNNGAGMAGGVAIRDSLGAFPHMAGLDSTNPDWVDLALDRWDGNVRTGEHGVARLNLTIEDPTTPRRLIEPGLPTDTQGEQDAKMWYAADLRIINGQGFDSAGNPVSLIDPLTATSAVRNTVLFDQREQKHVLTTEIDMDKLGRVPGYPANGMVYVGGFEPGNGMPAWQGGAAGVGPPEWVGYDAPWSGTDTTLFGVKLTNGDELAGPLTVISDNPAYVHGDYNVVNKQGAAVIADAVTILSNRWGDIDGDGTFDDDLAYSELALNSRNAWSTTVNAAVMLGNSDSVPNVEYNGGVENVMRFLERWSGDTFTYLGSIIDLWNSLNSTGTWAYGSPVYTAPSRNWGFDTDFLDPAKLPPGTPTLYTIHVIGWDRS